MTEITKNNETDQESSVYDELPDAPPKQKLKLSWTGKIGVAIVAFWILMVFIGPYVAPFHEADIIADDMNRRGRRAGARHRKIQS